jgi:hypothetical protein
MEMVLGNRWSLEIHGLVLKNGSAEYVSANSAMTDEHMPQGNTRRHVLAHMGRGSRSTGPQAARKGKGIGYYCRAGFIGRRTNLGYACSFLRAPPNGL